MKHIVITGDTEYTKGQQVHDRINIVPGWIPQPRYVVHLERNVVPSQFDCGRQDKLFPIHGNHGNSETPHDNWHNLLLLSKKIEDAEIRNSQDGATMQSPLEYGTHYTRLQVMLN